jgi:hypothetical protein
MTETLPLTILFYLLFGSGQVALGAALQGLTCEGDLPVFAVSPRGYHPLNKINAKTFETTVKEASALRIGIRPEHPHLEIAPWKQISHEQFSKNITDGLSVQFWSDGSTWFSVTERSKSLKITHRLYCNVVEAQAQRTPATTSIKHKPHKIAKALPFKRKCKTGSRFEKCHRPS